jgi:inhibitor of KinA
MEIRPAGDAAVAVYLGNEIAPAVNRLVPALAGRIRRDLEGVPRIEVTPGYVSLLVSYDPEFLSYERLVEVIGRTNAMEVTNSHRPRRFVLPTLYGGEFGPDLTEVARYHGVTEEEIIDLHTGRDYPIYCLGFSPGFPLCGGLQPALHTPRLETPRPRVPAGSVAIGGGQTGVYPRSTAGGWRLLGRCPLTLFDLGRTPPVAYRPEDVVSFRAIDEDTYRQLSENPSMPVGEEIERV